MIICPSCGSTVEGDLCLGCPSCGARAVGPPLAKAEHELPSFGRAFIASASGLVMCAAFLGALVAALVENKGAWLRFWTIVTAGEIAAWRVKWIALPVTIVVLWSGSRIIRSIRRDPNRFIGLRAARIGFRAAVVAAVMIVTLIGITVPERLRQRQDAIDAAIQARLYTLHRALLEYRELKGTYPTDIKDLGDKNILPDPDGSITEALRYVDPKGYQPSTILAASTKVKPLAQRGGALRNAPTKANADPPGISFTSYDLRLVSEHRLLSNDDDFTMHDGVITRLPTTRSSTAAPNAP